MENLDQLPAVQASRARPLLQDQEIQETVILQIGKLLARHDRHRKVDYDTEARRVFEQVPGNAYAIAVCLEDEFGYEPTADLIDLLHELWGLTLSVHQEAVGAWVAKKPVSLLPVGREIRVRDDSDRTPGKILSVDAIQARYRVARDGQEITVNAEDACPL